MRMLWKEYDKSTIIKYMKFLIDVNASRTLGQYLTEIGYEIAMVSDYDPRMKDEDILRWAVAENRVILTTDNDFEQMIWQQNQPHCGVLRLENLPRNERKILLEDALRCHRKDLEAGAIVIASKTKFRVRKPLSEV